MENEIKKIFSGSVIDAEFIGSFLEENGIAALVRNFNQESAMAGWANVTKDAAVVYVFKKDYDNAQKLLDDIKDAKTEVERPTE